MFYCPSYNQFASLEIETARNRSTVSWDSSQQLFCYTGTHTKQSNYSICLSINPKEEAVISPKSKDIHCKYFRMFSPHFDCVLLYIIVNLLTVSFSRQRIPNHKPDIICIFLSAADILLFLTQSQTRSTLTSTTFPMTTNRTMLTNHQLKLTKVKSPEAAPSGDCKGDN